MKKSGDEFVFLNNIEGKGRAWLIATIPLSQRYRPGGRPAIKADVLFHLLTEAGFCANNPMPHGDRWLEFCFIKPVGGVIDMRC